MNGRWSNFKIESWLTTLDFTQTDMCIKVWKLRNGSAWLGNYISLDFVVCFWLGGPQGRFLWRIWGGGWKWNCSHFVAQIHLVDQLTHLRGMRSGWFCNGSTCPYTQSLLSTSLIPGQVWAPSAVTGLPPLQDIQHQGQGNKNPQASVWPQFTCASLPNLPPISPSWLACPVDFKIHYCLGRQQP